MRQSVIAIYSAEPVAAQPASAMKNRVILAVVADPTPAGDQQQDGDPRLTGTATKRTISRPRRGRAREDAKSLGCCAFASADPEPPHRCSDSRGYWRRAVVRGAWVSSTIEEGLYGAAQRLRTARWNGRPPLSGAFVSAPARMRLAMIFVWDVGSHAASQAHDRRHSEGALRRAVPCVDVCAHGDELLDTRVGRRCRHVQGGIALVYVVENLVEEVSFGSLSSCIERRALCQVGAKLLAI